MKKHIPNILSIIRLCMIPLFVYLFFKDEKFLAILTFALASLTDILDGYLARRYGWVTPLGKLLDPAADKMMQATVITCVAIQNSDNIFFIIVAALFIFKELLMGVGAVIVIKKKRDIAVSNWYGKAATVAFFFITSIMIFNEKSITLNFLLAALLVAVFVTALLLYYFKVFRGTYDLKLRSSKQVEKTK